MKKGDYVKIKNNDFCGIIDSIQNNKVVIVNKNKKLTTTLSNLESITENDFINSIPNYTKSKYKNAVSNKPYTLTLTSTPENELMIRHQTELEAMSNVEKFLDTAFVNRLSSVKIIHGKRGGVLRRALHKLLDEHPYVESYELGDYFSGQYGVTIVHLKIMKD